MNAPAALKRASRPALDETQSHWIKIVGMVIRGYLPLFSATVFAGMGMNLCSIAAAGISAWLVGSAVTGRPAADLVPGLWMLAALVLPLVILPWLETTLAHIFAFHVLADMREKLYNAFERLAPGYILDRPAGDLGTAVMGDVELLELGYSHTFPPFFVALIVSLGVSIWMALQHLLLGTVLFLFLMTGFAIPIWIELKVGRKSQVVRDMVGQASGQVFDTLQGMREVLAFNARQLQFSRFKQYEEKLGRVQMAQGRTKALQAFVFDLISGGGTLLMVATAAVLVAGGTLDPVQLPVCASVAAASILPLRTMMAATREFSTVLSATRRVHAVLDTEPAVKEMAGTDPVDSVEPWVRFEKVRFAYQPDLQDVLDGVSLDIKPGESVALVGHSGAGKTTCANLLMRLWDVGGGRITIGGHDLRTFRQETLRRFIAYVPQDVYLFNQSVCENIRIGSMDASIDQMKAAARSAQAIDFIERLPQGMKTVVGERGIRLSGGERQRIAIARAILKNAPILIMDEAVSNLDAENSAALEAAMAKASQGRTVMIIAHRLSTIRAADRIVVLSQGRVVETGTHRELMRQNAEYARLIQSSREDFIE